MKKIGEKLKNLWNYFSLYEKIWFFSILILAIAFAFIFPEDEVNGVNGNIIMILYLCDIFFNILCELLISKQSKWNFIVSVLVEITEIFPIVRGVAIACTNGNDDLVRMKITDLISSYLGISSNRIKIVAID